MYAQKEKLFILLVVFNCNFSIRVITASGILLPLSFCWNRHIVVIFKLSTFIQFTLVIILPNFKKMEGKKDVCIY